MSRPRSSVKSHENTRHLLQPIVPAARGTTSTQVYDVLRRAIVTGELAPGATMSEVDIGEALNVSRTPVRETFRRLAGEGLLQIAPQVGTIVCKMNRQTLADALFIRETIECATARLAAKAPLADRLTVRDVVLRQKEAIERGDFEDGLSKDEDLHRALIDISGHAGAWEPVRQARGHMERVRRMAIPELQGNTKALEQHMRIVDALIAGDTEVLVNELRGHIRLIEGFVDGIAKLHPDYFD